MYEEGAGWTKLTIGSNSGKDQVHVSELLKRLEPPSIKIIRDSLIEVQEIFIQQFDDLAAEADAQQYQVTKRK